MAVVRIRMLTLPRNLPYTRSGGASKALSRLKGSRKMGAGMARF